MSTYLLHFLFGVFNEFVALGHRFVERLVLGLVEFNLNEMEGEIQHAITQKHHRRQRVGMPGLGSRLRTKLEGV